MLSLVEELMGPQCVHLETGKVILHKRQWESQLSTAVPNCSGGPRRRCLWHRYRVGEQPGATLGCGRIAEVKLRLVEALEEIDPEAAGHPVLGKGELARGDGGGQRLSDSVNTQSSDPV